MDSQEWRWCLVGNIVEQHEYGEEHEIRYGTKQFSPGSKVYLAPACWGDGYEQIWVIGQPRHRSNYIEIVMRRDYIENFRVQKVFKPAVLKIMANSENRWWGDTDEERDGIARLADSLNASRDDKPDQKSMDRTEEKRELNRSAEATESPEETIAPEGVFPRFQGTLRKLRLVSNNMGYGPCPAPEDEIEQHLTITDKGRVWLTRYNYGPFGAGHGIVEKTSFSISRKVAQSIFSAVSEYFRNDYMIHFVTDVGCWDLELTNTDGRVFKVNGPLCGDLSTPRGGLSDIIREQTGHQEMFVFDGNPERVDKVEISYHRVTKIKSGVIPPDVDWEYVTWDYSEHLVLDRGTETLTMERVVGSGCKITNTYYVEEGVSGLLDDLYMDSFDDIDGNPPDVYVNPLEKKEYTISVTSKLGDVAEVTGTFDKNGLPTVWPDFIDDVHKFISFYGLGELFDDKVYGKVRRRQSELIFCNVVFEDGGKTYCYLADSDDYTEGNMVVVPAGPDNHEAVVRIESIEYHTAEEAPFPVEKAKHILRKY